MLGTQPFKGASDPPPRSPAATAPNRPPRRAPDVLVEEATTADQAALYRWGLGCAPSTLWLIRNVGGWD